MSIRCDICGEWSAGTGCGHRDICLPCFERNFAGNPLDTPAAREAMEDYALALDNPQLALTPRQLSAMARIAEVWRRQTGEGEA
jgi:hypothetical protein